MGEDKGRVPTGLSTTRYSQPRLRRRDEFSREAPCTFGARNSRRRRAQTAFGEREEFSRERLRRKRRDAPSSSRRRRAQTAFGDVLQHWACVHCISRASLSPSAKRKRREAPSCTESLRLHQISSPKALCAPSSSALLFSFAEGALCAEFLGASLEIRCKQASTKLELSKPQKAGHSRFAKGVLFSFAEGVLS